MSPTWAFHKDLVLGKLGECKDRASAALKALDNCDVELRAKTSFFTREKMPHHCRGPLIRERSRSKCKHSRERVYARPQHGCPFDDDSDSSDTDCSCEDCYPVIIRGRGLRRGSYIVGGEGALVQQNVSQQNINVIPHCDGIRRRRSRSRPVIVLPGYDHEDEWAEDREYIRAVPPQVVWHRGDQRNRERRHHGPTRGLYQVIQGEDGKMEMYNVERVVQNALDTREMLKKKEREAEEAQNKKCAETMELLNKVVRARPQSANTVPYLVGRGSPMSAWCAGGILDRSADDIRRELEECEADLKQCRARAALEARVAANLHRLEVSGHDAFCSGALKGDEEMSGYGQDIGTKTLLGGEKRVTF